MQRADTQLPESRMVRVLIVEASSGGVVGGSLTGLVHMVHGLDPARVAAGMVLYERKDIEAELGELGVPVFHVHRKRVRKEHALIGNEGYQRAKRVGWVKSALALGRQGVRLLVEELPTALRLARIIREFRADVVHLGNGVRANYDGLLACWLTRTPCVVHVKGFEKYSDRERAAGKRIDALVPMTKAVEQHCRERGVVGRRTQVIYDALADAGFRPQRTPAEVRKELGVGDAPLAGVASNIQEWKGQIVLVEAMAQVVRQVPAAQALIIGGVHRAGGDYAQRVHDRIAELGLQGNLRATGFRNDIADVTNALDIVVHTSVKPEPFGRVILEGMLLGKPVVASAAGGVPELIRDGETGFLFAPGDADGLAHCLVRLMQDEGLRRAIGERAREWASDAFSMERHVEAFSVLYEDLKRSDD